MANQQVYNVRPVSRPARTDFKDILRVYLSSTALLLLGLHSGDACHLKTPEGVVGPVILWPSPDKINDNVVQPSRSVQLLYDLKLSDKITILREKLSIKDARNVTIAEIPPADSKTSIPRLSEPDRLGLIWYLPHIVEKAEVLCPGVILDGVEIKGKKRCFVVRSVNSSTAFTLYKFQPFTNIQIEDDILDDSAHAHPQTPLAITTEGIGGLDKQLKELNDRLAFYGEERRRFKMPPFYRPRRGGVILHGASGTGKSMVIEKLSKAGWRKVLNINTLNYSQKSTERHAMIRDIFAEAHLHQPSIVIIDGIDSIAGKKDPQSLESATSVASSLCAELDRLGSARVFVVAAIQYLTNLDQNLRSPGRFEVEIEIPVPDSRARAQILKVVSGQPKDIDDVTLERLADRTHGFVGADLDRLVQLAVEKGMIRTLEGLDPPVVNGADIVESEIEVKALEPDFEKALLEVRPTAMREVFLETPTVRWRDVGGQQEIKAALEKAIEWPFKYPEKMERIGIEKVKGLLLYGPPGCSKTLIAKAVATETGLNFIAVKGAELLSMYVGESERAVREVFRKARAASPSVIFFDEIDAIGASREGNSSHGALNVLTTLLNELDGIEILKGVFVLAATNKPEVIDLALMRPGRLDKALYVGLPDLDARQEILQIRLRLMAVDDEVDIGAFAHSTDGYSGAEIVSICQKAGYAALEEEVKSGVLQKIGNRHFGAALAQVDRQVSREMIQKYKDWAIGRNIDT